MKTLIAFLALAFPASLCAQPRAAEMALPEAFIQLSGSIKAGRQDLARTQTRAAQARSKAVLNEKSFIFRVADALKGLHDPRRNKKVVYQFVHAKKRYENTPAFRAVTAEFMSDPDLKAINQRFNRDQNVSSLASSLVLTPHFWKLVGKYGSRPEIHSFAMDLLRTPSVKSVVKI